MKRGEQLLKNATSEGLVIVNGESIVLTLLAKASIENYKKEMEQLKQLKSISRNVKQIKIVSIVILLICISMVLPSIKLPSFGNKTPSKPIVLKGDFKEQLLEIESNHKKVLESDFDPEKLSSVTTNNPNDNTLTNSEVELLTQFHRRNPTFSISQAKQDVELLFKAFQSGYGAYYYFGSNAFENAKQQILNSLPTSGEIDTSLFENIVSASFSFMKDAHAAVVPQGTPLDNRPYEDSIRKHYFYCLDYQFTKEKSGNNVTTIDGKKYNFVGFSSDKVGLELTLTLDGKLCYDPTMFDVFSSNNDCSLIVENNKKETISVNLEMVMAESLYEESQVYPDYNLINREGVYYLSLRSFMDMDSTSQSQLDCFVNEAEIIKEARMIIFDIRGNDFFADQWIQRYSNQKPQRNLLFASRNSLFNNPDNSNLGSFELFVEKAKQIENKTPILYLLTISVDLLEKVC